MNNSKLCIVCGKHIANRIAMPTSEGYICNLICAKASIGAEAFLEWQEEEFYRRSNPKGFKIIWADTEKVK